MTDFEALPPTAPLAAGDVNQDGESRMLLGFLQHQRDAVLKIVEGLPEDAWQTPVVPSGWARRTLMTQPASSRERAALLECLNDQRSHVLGVLKGLPEEALRQPVLPSGWTCLGMVRELIDGRTWLGPEDSRLPRD